MKQDHAVIIDDDRLMRNIVDRTLSETGFKTVQASNGEEGLEAVMSVLPELVVLDIWMPGKFDGVQVCEALRADPRFRKTVIVMMTASDQRKEADRCLAAGANIMIPKPFSPKRFRDMVNALIKDNRRK